MSATMTSRRFTVLRRAARGLAVLAVGAGIAGTAAESASAATIQQPRSVYCHSGEARLSVDPVRVWAERGRPETVLWRQSVERWNAGQWRPYVVYENYATFDYFGRNATGWSVDRNSRGGRYVNSRMSLPISHTGWYRVASIVATSSGTSSAVYVAGGNSCRITS